MKSIESSSLSDSTIQTVAKSLHFLSESSRESFFHAVADIACGHDTPLSSFGAPNMTTPLSEALQEVFLLAAGQNWNQDSINQAFTSSLSSITEVFSRVFSARFSELRRRIIEDASTFSPYYLKDIDWVTKLVLASDTASVLRETVLLVTLHLSSRSGIDRTIKLELTKKEVDTLIETLSNAAALTTPYLV